MKVTLEGGPHLGAAVGTQGLYVMDKVQQWSREIDTLAGFYCPNPTPHCICCLHSRHIPNIGHMLQPIKDIIRTELAPALTRRPPPNDHECHSTTQPRLLIWSCCCQLMAKEEIHKQKRQQWTLATTSKFYPTLYKRSRYLAEVKGVSSWLTSLLIGFSLQGDLALALQYDWQPTCTLSNCVCHTKFSIEDALSCFVLSLYCYVFVVVVVCLFFWPAWKIF